ncbi:MAG: Rpn family recombination-promoting nuclease/putative transposase [Polyangiaceae bacterium]|nr:Rpn family recombination-promoting nuclease/putative transposase [Myxococcales bacterium]MCB9585046.1 Rpn family recombination-promoting nuclease/putative transposase [Polyangiaceae bacterium]MCB9610063.1 Rpn family recombination-promoting nuclease/putative transposase [Polyangiaceae bacterium]
MESAKPEPTPPRQPHDVLVKQIFGDPKNARVELEAVLPAPIVAAIDWSTLEVLPETFIDPAFAKTQADLLFRVQLAGRDARLYIVFEHKSDSKAETLVQVGRYVLDVLARYFQHGGKLPAPVVLPIVLHHSKAGWPVAQSFEELFDPAVLAIPGVREHVPHFRVVLDDISHQTDEALRTRAKDAASLIVPLTLWALRDSRDDEAIRGAFAHWALVIAILWRLPDARTGLFFVLHYLTLLTQALTEGDLLEALGDATPEAKEAMTTLAEKWMAQGEARGRTQGERRALERLLRRKFGDAVLDDSVLSRLAAADEAQLEQWTDRVLDAQRLEDVFG